MASLSSCEHATIKTNEQEIIFSRPLKKLIKYYSKEKEKMVLIRVIVSRRDSHRCAEAAIVPALFEGKIADGDEAS